MAQALPRGEFTKLGLNANNLKTASSLSSSMTELRTEGGGSSLTRRRDKVVNKEQKLDLTSQHVYGKDGWWIYSHTDMMGKFHYHAGKKDLEKDPRRERDRLAFYNEPFAEGAERYVFQCTEIEVPKDKFYDWYQRALDLERMDMMKAKRSGLRLVAKEAWAIENMHKGRDFHETFARVQFDALKLAVQFNMHMPVPRPEWNVSFLPTHIYQCFDVNYKFGEAWVLVEQELEGKFTKWNNNAERSLTRARRARPVPARRISHSLRRTRTRRSRSI